MTPSEWAKQRIYPPTSGWPGPRDATITPYMLDWARVVADGTAPTTAMVCGAQMGKTDTQLDIMGERLDNRPTPILYVGPSKEFVTDQFEPRFVELLKQAKRLGAKASKKRQKKTLKRVAGVRVRFAHAGSSTALKSDPAGLALVDEYDEMLRDVKKQGDPLGLLNARGFTYSDFTKAVASTPSRGVVDSEIDMASALEFWKEAPIEDLESAIWKLFQSGTMHHWAWPCPHCDEYFVPRLKLLRWPEGATAAHARRNAHLECPNCKAAIVDELEGEAKGRTKAWMNERGVMVARGQWIERGNMRDGSRIATVVGEPKDTDTISYWVSGLASPFVSWGDRASEMVDAEGDPEKMQVAVNAGGGELYAPGGGDLPEWKEVMQLVRPYSADALPIEATVITAGIDVQKLGLYYVLRAWGPRGTSWKVKSGFLFGDTTQNAVWIDLSDLLAERHCGMPVKIAFVDSGFRPGKPDAVPENMVYAFCRRHSRFVYPSKGHDHQMQPIRRSKIEVDPTGGAAKFGLELMHLDSDFFKSMIHERVRWPVDQPGAFFLDEDTDEAYARQIVSEARVRANGKATWVRKTRDNHYLDCEAMAAAAGYFLNVQRIGLNRKRGGGGEEPGEETPPTSPTSPTAPSAAPAPAPLPSAGTQAEKFAKMAARLNMRR